MYLFLTFSVFEKKYVTKNAHNTLILKIYMIVMLLYSEFVAVNYNFI